MKTIWFNHWFSTAYQIILLLRKENPDFRIIGTNRNLQSPIASVCDAWYQEPCGLSEEAYVDFCLSFCREHSVDVFLPRRGMLEISRRKEEFAALGVRVMADDFPAVDMLNHKDAA
nr:hypothetical protein [Oscillospiraceae bacterium]